MTESAPPRETRQQKAAREIAEAEQMLRDLDEKLRLGRAFVADRSHPLRKRATARVRNGVTRIGIAAVQASIRLRKPNLQEQTASERMQARSREHFDLAEESRRRGNQPIDESSVAARRPALSATIDFVVGWLILGTAIAADYLVFRAFGVNYFHWYLDAGALINLVFGLISLAVVLDAYRDLISSNPMRYFNACTALFLHVLLAWDATIIKDDTAEPTWWLPAFFDGLVSVLLYIVMLLVTLGWLLVVAPIQHVVFAVLGAPARNAFRNKKTASYDPVRDKTTLAAAVAEPRTGFTIGYRDKPVTLTAALASAAFWLISIL
ncbi:MAG TPA: hypothetical protein VLK53_09000 [Gaiellaceae bacterium]|nr:hypothetical protein [Gaiellaceae bacterium]